MSRTSSARRSRRSGSPATCSTASATTSRVRPRAPSSCCTPRPTGSRRLLADLLEISRYDAGSVELETEPTNLVHLADDAIESMHELGRQHGSELRLVAPGGHLDAEVDPRRIRRIVRNLLGNAIEHGEGRPIVVSVDSNESAIALSVRDYGLGMTEDEAARVFDRFWRADPSRMRTIGGTGLGLAISLEDAVAHGGTLDVWSEPGEGSVFRLTLPRADGRGPRSSRRSRSARAADARSPRGPRRTAPTSRPRMPQPAGGARWVGACSRHPSPLVVLVLTGCATIPSSGPVQAGDPVPPASRPDIDILVPGPVAGADAARDPQRLHRCGAQPAEQLRGRARVPDADRSATNGRPTRAPRSTCPPIERSQTIDDTLMRISATPAAALGPNGQYEEPDSSTPIPLEYRFEQVDGEWRISSAPRGILIDQVGFTQVFDDYTLYFFDPTFQLPRARPAVVRGARSGADEHREGHARRSGRLARPGCRVGVPRGRAARAGRRPRRGRRGQRLPHRRRVRQRRHRAGDAAAARGEPRSASGDPRCRAHPERRSARRARAPPFRPTNPRVDPRTVCSTARSSGHLATTEEGIEPDPRTLRQGRGARADGRRARARGGVGCGPRRRRRQAGALGEEPVLLDPSDGLIMPAIDDEGIVWSVPASLPDELAWYAPDGTASGRWTCRGAPPRSRRWRSPVTARASSRCSRRAPARTSSRRRSSATRRPARRARRDAARDSTMSPGTPLDVPWLDSSTVASITALPDGATRIVTQELGGIREPRHGPIGGVLSTAATTTCAPSPQTATSTCAAASAGRSARAASVARARSGRADDRLLPTRPRRRVRRARTDRRRGMPPRAAEAGRMPRPPSPSAATAFRRAALDALAVLSCPSPARDAARPTASSATDAAPRCIPGRRSSRATASRVGGARVLRRRRHGDRGLQGRRAHGCRSPTRRGARVRRRRGARRVRARGRGLHRPVDPGREASPRVLARSTCLLARMRHPTRSCAPARLGHGSTRPDSASPGAEPTRRGRSRRAATSPGGASCSSTTCSRRAPRSPRRAGRSVPPGAR